MSASQATNTPSGLTPGSLIICSRNRPQLLRETIESVLAGKEVPSEIIIIDQSTQPVPTLDALGADRGCEFHHIFTHSVGLSRARNKGIASAKHVVLVWIDDDILVEPAWYGRLVRTLTESGARTVVTGQVRPVATDVRGGYAPATKVDDVPAVFEGRVGQDVLFPSNMALYRSVTAEVGGFDERLGAGGAFPSAEDNDFGFRLLEAGYRIVYEPRAVVYHRAWRSRRDYVPLQWNYGRGQGAYYAKHLSLHDSYMLQRMIKDIRRHIVRVPRRLWSQPLRACGDAVYVAGILAGASQWMLRQNKTR